VCGAALVLSVFGKLAPATLVLPEVSQIKGLRLFAGFTTDIERSNFVGQGSLLLSHAQLPGQSHGQAQTLDEVIFEMRFSALNPNGASLCFPCNCAGQVNLDGLSSTVKREYLYARAMIGLEYGYPVVVCCTQAD
jgi:hypothetical protein